MPSPRQSSFISGELAPALYARADTDLYHNGLRTARNVIVLPSGGVEKRAGLIFGGYAKGDARLVPCVLATGQEYLLEIGPNYIRFWLSGGLMRLAATPASWASATPYGIGDLVTHNGTNYYCTAAHTSGSPTEPGIGAGWQSFWYSLVDDIYEIPTPYPSLEVIRHLQFADESQTTRFVAHPEYPLHELVRVSATVWTFRPVVFSAGDAVAAPTNLSIADPGTGNQADFTRYQVTALNGSLESEPSNIAGWNKRPGPLPLPPLSIDSGNRAPLDLSWDSVGNATAYNVYRSFSGGPFVLITRVTTNGYTDVGEIAQGADQTPPDANNPITDLTVAGQYPGVITAFQQRLIVSGQRDWPDAMYASRVANFRNWFPRWPLQDDDATSWRQVGGRLNRVLHVVEQAGRLVVFSEIAEGLVMGDTDGVIRPGEVNPRNFSWNGADPDLPPLSLNTSLLYVQARGSIVRDFQPGADATGVNLSLPSEHLIRGRTLRWWTYQQTPNSVVWMARDDGKMLALTYDHEYGIRGWTRHDTIGGSIRSLATIPLAGQDVVCALVVRGGYACVEMMGDRMVGMDSMAMGQVVPPSPVTDTSFAFVPTGATLDINANRLEESGGTSVHGVGGPFLDWRPFHSSYQFGAYMRADERSEVMLQFHLPDHSPTVSRFYTIDLAAGTITPDEPHPEFDIEASISPHTGGFYRILLTCSPNATVAGTPTWSETPHRIARVALSLMDGGEFVYAGTSGFGIDCEVWDNATVTNVPLSRIVGIPDHLITHDVVVQGYVPEGLRVLANPLDPALPLVSVTGDGTYFDAPDDLLSDQVFVGLPIVADVQTLDIEQVQGSRKDTGINVTRLGMWLEEATGFWCRNAEPTDDTSLSGFQFMAPTDENGNPTASAVSGYREVNIDGAWNRSGRIFVRHIDPTPFRILAVHPQGDFGERR